MTDAQNILVVFLSTFLGLFLLLGCIALVKTIQILNHLKSISEKAEKIADTAEHVGEFFKYSAGPAAVAKLLANITDHVFNKGAKRNKKGSDES
jgi:hypothetical protein